MRLTLKCYRCESELPIDAAEAPDEVACGRCGQVMPLTLTDVLRRDRAVDVCPVCEGREFYRRKDFNPQVGLAVVVAGALVSAAFYWFGQDLMAYGVLGIAVVIDLVVYGRLKDVTVCYRCHSEFRGRYEVSAPFFDLATADELELEWGREVEKRLKSSAGQSVS